MRQSQQEVSENVEHVNVATSWAVVLIVGARFPMRECDHDVAAHVLNAERSVIGRKIRIEENTG